MTGFHGTVLSNFGPRKSTIWYYPAARERQSNRGSSSTLYSREGQNGDHSSYLSQGKQFGIESRVMLDSFFLELAGVDNESIAQDYALTRIGREPIRELIMGRLALEPIFASNNEAALNMFTCR